MYCVHSTDSTGWVTSHRPTPPLAKYLGEGTQDSGSADSGNGDVCHIVVVRTQDRVRHQRR